MDEFLQKKKKNITRKFFDELYIRILKINFRNSIVMFTKQCKGEINVE